MSERDGSSGTSLPVRTKSSSRGRRSSACRINFRIAWMTARRHRSSCRASVSSILLPAMFDGRGVTGRGSGAPPSQAGTSSPSPSWRRTARRSLPMPYASSSERSPASLHRRAPLRASSPPGRAHVPVRVTQATEGAFRPSRRGFRIQLLNSSRNVDRPLPFLRS